MTTLNRQVLLKSRPAGIPQADNFEIVDTPSAIEDRPDAPGTRIVIRVGIGDDEAPEPVPREIVAIEER